MEKLGAIACTASSDAEKTKFLSDMEGFSKLFHTAFLSGKEPLDWAKIHPPPSDMVLNHTDLAPCPPELMKSLLDKLVVLKLNGGLGTTMGCTGPKSLIEVHSGYTFLDLTVTQIQQLNETYEADVPLVLMNSFNTDSDSQKSLPKYAHHGVTIHTFNQHRYPRVVKETMSPLPETLHGNLGDWNPPGHGDVFEALIDSPVFQLLKDAGKEFIFISNIDNLGATVDFCMISLPLSLPPLNPLSFSL